MNLFPDRYPQRDFFVLDIIDAVPKDDMASMEHPLFSLATKPDMRHLHYGVEGHRLEIVPSGIGLPTIFDKDILIFAISQLMHRKNQGEAIGKRVQFTAHQFLIATNRPTNNLGYQRLRKSFQRLRGTTFTTDIKTGNRVESRSFGMIDEGGFVGKENDAFRLDHCEIVLSDWLMRAIETDQTLTINRDYFRLRRPLERRLYEIARKHCGSQKKWTISLNKLQTKTGSNAPLKKFRLNLREIIVGCATPGYEFELNGQDIVTIRPRKAPKAGTRPPNLSIPEKDEEEARRILSSAGLDYQAVRAEWIDFALDQAAEGTPPKRPGPAFVGFCRKQVAG